MLNIIPDIIRNIHMNVESIIEHIHIRSRRQRRENKRKLTKSEDDEWRNHIQHRHISKKGMMEKY